MSFLYRTHSWSFPQAWNQKVEEKLFLFSSTEAVCALRNRPLPTCTAASLLIRRHKKDSLCWDLLLSSSQYLAKKLSYCANCAASLFSSGEVIVHKDRRMSADLKHILQPVHVLKSEDVNVHCELSISSKLWILQILWVSSQVNWAGDRDVNTRQHQANKLTHNSNRGC